MLVGRMHACMRVPMLISRAGLSTHREMRGGVLGPGPLSTPGDGRPVKGDGETFTSLTWHAPRAVAPLLRVCGLCSIRGCFLVACSQCTNHLFFRLCHHLPSTLFAFVSAIVLVLLIQVHLSQPVSRPVSRPISWTLSWTLVRQRCHSEGRDEQEKQASRDRCNLAGCRVR